MIYMEREDSESIGFVVGESSTNYVLASFNGPVRRGQYVLIRSPDNGETAQLIGLIEEVLSKNPVVEEPLSLEDVLSLKNIDRDSLINGDTVIYAKIKLLATLKFGEENGKIQLNPPITAPKPLSEVRIAPNDVLMKIFSRSNEESAIEIGVLTAHPEVRVYIDANKMVSRHLAILAVTGAGKSNTVTVISSELVKRGGTILIFDMHGEYSHAFPQEYVNEIEAKVNPAKLDIGGFSKLIGLKDAPKQELYLRNILAAWDAMYGVIYKNESYFFDFITSALIELINQSSKISLPIIREKELVKSILKEAVNVTEEDQETSNRLLKSLIDRKRPIRTLVNLANYLQKDSFVQSLSSCSGKAPEQCESAITLLDISSSDRNTVLPSLLVKVEESRNRYESIIDFNTSRIVERLEPGKVNVINLSQVDEEAADIIVSTVLKEILRARKLYVQKGDGERGLPYPIFLVLEEAHILAPKDRTTLTKYWTARIAREGRKFGVGICLVSQRPKGLDQDTLSQANNMIIMRLIEPMDQKHVQASSESLSDDLMKQLPSLGVGEAIVLGPMITLPAIVKINKAEGKTFGTDIDVISEWRKLSKKRESHLAEEDVW